MRKFFGLKNSDAGKGLRLEPSLRPAAANRGRAAAGAPADDFDLSDEGPLAPARPSAGRKARTRRQLGGLRASTVAGAAFGAVMVAIGVNAVALQRDRHPAPWFDKAPKAQEPAAQQSAPRPEAALPAPQRPAPQSAAVEPPPAAPALKPKAPERPRDTTASVDRKPKDPVGDLLKAGKTPSASPEPSPAVAAIQRTLARLGYAVTIDGMIGPATQRAIAQFEHDHRLPVKGQLTARLFQEITAASKH